MLRHNTNHKCEILGLSNNNNMNHNNNSSHKAPNPAHATTNHSNQNKILASGSPLDALPKQFVASMKKLFDILDEQNSGYVKFGDIEKGWQDDGCKGLPSGVVDSLRKVTPTSGLLSFERFCTGLKICLLKNQAVASTTTTTTTTLPATTLMMTTTTSNRPAAEMPLVKSKLPQKPPRPPSAPLLQIENPLPNATWLPNVRALSLPQLSPDSLDLALDMEAVTTSAVSSPPVFNADVPPPKPPRSGAKVSGILTTVPSSNAPPPPLDKAEIRHALQHWQMGVLLNEMDAQDKRKNAFATAQFPAYRGCADGGSSSTTDSAPTAAFTLPSKSKLGGGGNKRREPRRHTLQHGIDYNMLKRLKQCEEERAVLLLGLQSVEQARDWYRQQLVAVQEKMRYLGGMGAHVEQWSEVQQERLNFQRARVLELNRNLATLTESWKRDGGGFATHINLATSAPLQRTGSCLRQQNRQLTTEVNLQNERITLLEREKRQLLREMYHLQQQQPLPPQQLTVHGLEGNALMSVLSQASPVCSSSSGGLGDADVVY